jgi:hypothetical protein
MAISRLTEQALHINALHAINSPTDIPLDNVELFAESAMNCWIPNFLTLSRIFLLPPVMLLLKLDSPAAPWFALSLFLAASLTDALDGCVSSPVK